MFSTLTTRNPVKSGNVNLAEVSLISEPNPMIVRGPCCSKNSSSTGVFGSTSCIVDDVAVAEEVGEDGKDNEDVGTDIIANKKISA